MNRVLRGLGWLFIAFGVLVLLYLVYSLLYTNRATEQAQNGLADEWELSLPDGQQARDDGDGDGDGDGEANPPDPGSAVAVLEFRRPGRREPLVHEEPLYVVRGVTLADLQRGPGHYAGTALPGERGNFAVAGHRTTYGAPFFNLDQLRKGDEVVVTARNGRQYTYRVRRQQIVSPNETWVLAPDPLERGNRTLTLTTCHPRFSNVERLIVFAEITA
ncbi:MAG: class E sortase [Nitriliruptorales bacterium]|nr:class E sortase [Nitriliruptorales bacterium]